MDFLLDIFGIIGANFSLIYWGCIILGVVMVVISFLFGGLLDLAFDMDGGPFSGPVLASFLVLFGAAGLILRHGFEFGPVPSALGAGAFGFVGSAVFYGAFLKLILGQEGGTTYDPALMAGREAEVITGIPANGTGEITFDTSSGRVGGPARSSTGEDIPNHSLVVIDRHVGGTFLVRPLAAPDEKKVIES